jgi:hypothetical protein
MIEVGQKVRFDALAAVKNSVEKLKADTTGTVVYINEPHRWFLVVHDENQRISFKFSEIGQNVFLCK